MSVEGLPFSIQFDSYASRTLGVEKHDFESLKSEFPSLSDFEILSLLINKNNAQELSVLSQSIDELYTLINDNNLMVNGDSESENYVTKKSTIEVKGKIGTIRFHIRKDRLNRKGLCPIEVWYSFKGNRVYTKSGLFVNPELWDSKLRRLILDNNTPSIDRAVNNEINEKLDAIEEHTKTIESKLFKSGHFSADNVMKELVLFIHPFKENLQ